MSNHHAKSAAKAGAISTLQHRGTIAQRSGTLSAAACLVLLGVSTTLYVTLNISAFSSNSFLRPVQLVPVLLSVFVLPRMRWPPAPNTACFYFLPLLLTSYIIVRMGAHGQEGMMVALRSVVNLLGYWTMLCLLDRTRGEYGYTGLLLGCLASVAIAVAGISLFDVVPRMGSGRWQGFMPGANRFGNLCLVSLTVSVSLAITQPRSAIIHLVLAALSMGGVLMSGSRACLALAALGILLVYAVRAVFERRSPISGSTIVATMIIGTAILGTYSYLQERIPERIVRFVDRITNPGKVFEEDSRAELHDMAYEEFVSNPLFGAGIEAERFEVITAEGDVLEIGTHSTYWYLLSMSGLLGLILFLSLPLLILREFYLTIIARRAASLSGNILVSLPVLLVFGLHNSMISLSNAMHTWILLGACAILQFNVESSGCIIIGHTMDLACIASKDDQPGPNIRTDRRQIPFELTPFQAKAFIQGVTSVKERVL